MTRSPAETVDRLRKQAWDRNVEPENTMMLEAADVIVALMDAANRNKAAAAQIKARSVATSSDDEKELRRQMMHISTLADSIINQV